MSGMDKSLDEMIEAERGQLVGAAGQGPLTERGTRYGLWLGGCAYRCHGGLRGVGVVICRVLPQRSCAAIKLHLA